MKGARERRRKLREGVGGERREEEGWRRVKDDSRIQSLESNEQVHHI